MIPWTAWRARWQQRAQSRTWLCLKAGAMLAGIVVLGLWAVRERAVMLGDRALLEGLLVILASMACYALRFRAVLGIGGIRIGRLDALRITTLSVFWHFFVPLSVGAELTRFTRVRDHAPSRTALEVGAILVLDHAIGATVLLAVSSLLLITLAPFGQWSWLLPAGVWGTALLAAVLGRALLRPGSALDSRLQLLWRERRGVLWAVWWSVLMHFLLAAGVFAGSRHWQLPIDFPHLALVMVSAGLFHLLPVNVAGAGASDVAGLGLYLALGLGRPEALLLVSLLYCYRLATGLLGGLWALLESRRRIKGYAG